MALMSIFSAPCGYLTFDGHDLDPRARLDALFESLDGIGLVHLDADHGFFGADLFPNDGGAAKDGFRPLHHEAVVVGEEGLTFAAVDDQRLDRRLLRVPRI